MNSEPLCCSNYALDCLASEASFVGEAQARLHLGACDRCQRRLEQVRQSQRAFEGREPTTVVAPLRRWRTRRLLSAAAGLVAAAAAVLFVVGPAAVPGERSKGGPRLELLVKQGETVSRGAEPAIVHPGDGLRFAVTLGAPRFVAILSIDAQATNLYYPRGAWEPTPAGSEQLLEGSIVLDEVLGEERVLAVFCQDRIDLEETRRRFERAVVAPPGCELTERRLLKNAGGS